MKLSLDTETDSYERVLATVKAAYAIATEQQGSDLAAHDGDYYPGAWTQSRLKRFTGELSDYAAEVVRYVAAHAPVVKVDQVIDHMSKTLGEEVTGNQLGGHMSSVGYSWKSVPGAKAAPLNSNYSNRTYVMDEGIAAVLRDIMGPPART